MSTNKKGNKPSKAELQRRIAIVTDLLARKFKRSEIYEYIRNETDWNITHNTMYMYINRAKGEISKAIQRNAMENLAESMMDMRHLYRKALEAEDLKTALAIRKEMNAIMDVNIHRIEPTEVGGGEMSNELEGMISDITPARKRQAQ